MSWGESRWVRRIILECPRRDCSYAILSADGLVSARFCPEHSDRLEQVAYVREDRPPVR